MLKKLKLTRCFLRISNFLLTVSLRHRFLAILFRFALITGERQDIRMKYPFGAQAFSITFNMISAYSLSSLRLALCVATTTTIHSHGTSVSTATTYAILLLLVCMNVNSVILGQNSMVNRWFDLSIGNLFFKTAKRRKIWISFRCYLEKEHLIGHVFNWKKLSLSLFRMNFLGWPLIRFTLLINLNNSILSSPPAILRVNEELSENSKFKWWSL